MSPRKISYQKTVGLLITNLAETDDGTLTRTDSVGPGSLTFLRPNTGMMEGERP